MTGQGTGTQLPFTCPGPLRPAFHAPPKSLRISHIIAQAALKALPPRAPNTPPHGALRTLAQDLWPSCTSLDPSPRPTRHRPGPPGAPLHPRLWELPQGLQASRCPPGTLRGTGTGSPADPVKAQAKASDPAQTAISARPPGLPPLSPPEPGSAVPPRPRPPLLTRNLQTPSAPDTPGRTPRRPHGGSRRPESPAALTHTAGSPPHTGPATPKALPPGTGGPGAPGLPSRRPAPRLLSPWPSGATGGLPAPTCAPGLHAPKGAKATGPSPDVPCGSHVPDLSLR